jgi:hypothetical protein
MMKRYLCPPFVACLAIWVAQAQAMPLAPPLPVPSVNIPVSSGCGLGVHRGPFDGCGVVYDGNYVPFARGPYNRYYVGFYGAGAGACGGRGTHYICNRIGLCRVVCN